MCIYLWALHYAMACMNNFCKDFRLVLSHLSAHCDTFYVFLTGFCPVLLTLRCTLKVIPHDGTGGGLMDPLPPLEVLICCSILKRFCLQWKAFDLLYSMRYILWVVALLEVWDVTKKHINNSFSSFYPQTLLLFLKKVENFTQKWLDHLLLMM